MSDILLSGEPETADELTISPIGPGRIPARFGGDIDD
jgi:hypothetical protein